MHRLLRFFGLRPAKLHFLELAVAKLKFCNSLGILLAFLLWGTGLSGQSAGGPAGTPADAFPRLKPDPKALEYAHLSARGYSWTDLAEISLWASGEELTAANRSASLEQIRAAATELLLSPELPASGRERAEYILSFIHKKFLKSYSLYQTRIDTLLAGGRYNCVSSAVLYLIFATSAGVDISGVMTKDHAFAAVHLGGEDIDVETTSPYGFDPGSRREFHDGFGKITGFAYVPARNYRDRMTISPIELVSLILSNRISELERGGRFAEAVPLAVDRAALLGRISRDGEASAEQPQTALAPAPFFEDPRRDMVNRLFNYGAFLLNAGKEEDCLRWTAFAAPQYPGEKRWQELALAAVNNRMQKLVKAGHIGAAREFLDKQTAAVGTSNYAVLDSMLFDTELLSGASGMRHVSEGDSLLAAIEQGRNSKRLSAERAAELLNFTVQRIASMLSAAPGRDWLSAIDYIEKTIARFGPTRELEQTLRNYQSSRAADFHNRFAAAYNKRNFEEAMRIVREGLAEFPADRRLLADQEIAEQGTHANGQRDK
jgi:hypothetical protein